MYVTANGVQLRLSAPINNWPTSHSYAETLVGTDKNDAMYSTPGDTLLGGNGDDSYYIWDTSPIIVEQAGPGGGVDTLYDRGWGAITLADNVENLILESKGATYALGNALDNIIVAGPAGSFVDGMGGDDVLVGSAGADTFSIRAGNGSDAIEKFEIGKDVIRLQGYGISSFDTLKAGATQVGADVRLALSDTESLVLRDVQLCDLKAGDFRLSIDTSKMSLSFGDEFSALTLRSDGGIWLPNYGTGWAATDHGYATESEVYVDPDYAGSGSKALGLDPFSVKDGVLSITAAPIDPALQSVLGNKSYTSGVISTNHAFSQQYGYFEIRAALPESDGMWPAFWLLPQSGDWPPEIDIMESLGKDAGQIYMTSHDSVNGQQLSDQDKFRVDDPGAMHTYGLDWSADWLVWYIDGTEVARQATPDSMKTGEFYMNLNLAVGGAWAGDATGATDTFDIDYVRVYNNEDTVSRTINGVHEVFDASAKPGKENTQAVITLYGTGVDDTLNGNANDNTLYGYAGNDIINGGIGADKMIGGKGNDTYYVDNVGDTVVEKAAEGRDSVISSVNFTLGDNVENLTLTGAAIKGTGNALDNVITGNDCANILDGGAGVDMLVGGRGNDSYIVDNWADKVIEAAGGGNDTVLAKVSYVLTSGQEIETIQAFDQSSTVTLTLTGNEFANTLIGNAGANFLDGGAGADRMVGGLGNDNYYVDNVGDVVVEGANAGWDIVNSTISYALGNNVEGLRLMGGAAINGTGNALNNVINGNDAANILDGCAGTDTMTGGLGNDTYIVDVGGDKVIEDIGGGIDTVLAKVSYALASGQEIETIQAFDAASTASLNLTGNEFANTLVGNAGKNILDGGAGADRMVGGDGNDTYYVDNAGDVIVEKLNEGWDVVNSSVSYALADNVDALKLVGNEALNGTGNAANNILIGNVASNFLDGGAGNDQITGGAGADRLKGGDGADRFIFADGDTGNTAATADCILDFSRAQGDKIDLTGIDANVKASGDQAFTLHASGTDYVAGALWLSSNGNFTVVNMDTDGDGKADYLIHVTSQTASPLVASDFIF
jgi:Ca2+-binding RTX toxin-like protein